MERFLKTVDDVCRRPGMYVGKNSLSDVCIFFVGYAHGDPDSPISGKGAHAFNQFICAKYRFPDNYYWSYVLKECSRDDSEGIKQLGIHLTEFAKRTLTESYDEIVQNVINQAGKQEEGEPEKTWRKFSRALLRGQKDIIVSLIQGHPDAEVLWSGGGYPSDVVVLMEQIQDESPVSCIPGCGDEDNVLIITPDIGTVWIKRINGSWRVDATKIISIWKARKVEKA